MDQEKWLNSLANSVSYYPFNGPHVDIVNDLIRSWFVETEPNVISMRNRLAKMGGTLDVGVLDSDRIEGNSVPGYDPDTGESSSLAQISLGIFPKVLGLSNRAHVARYFGHHEPWVADAFDEWSINDKSVGVLNWGGGHVERDTRNSVHDCATLALFHEVAHCQEPFPEPITPEQSRATEACADEGAGFLFVQNLTAKTSVLRKLDETEILSRIADASFFLSVLVHWASTNSDKKHFYHHPWTRMRCFTRGACLALYGAEVSKWRHAFDLAWDRQSEYSLAIAVFTPGELWYWHAHEEILADWRSFLTETHPLMNEMRDQLRDGLLLTPLTRGMKWIEHFQ
jgi:hypothetical protein